MNYYIKQNVYEYVPKIKINIISKMDESWHSRTNSLRRVVIKGDVYLINVNFDLVLKDVISKKIDNIPLLIGDHVLVGDEYYKITNRLSDLNDVYYLVDGKFINSNFEFDDELISQLDEEYQKLLWKKRNSSNIFDQIGVMFSNLFKK